MRINVQAVTDQKIAVGAVENPACWRLRDLAKQVPADQAIVELGAFKGRTAGWLALGASEGNRAHVYSVDPWEQRPFDTWPDGYDKPDVVREYSHPATRDAFHAHLAECGVTNMVTAIQATAVAAANTYDGPKVGLLWHDAEHTTEAVKADLKAWLPHLSATAVVALHDAARVDFGVIAGARAVLTKRHGFDWTGRELQLWPKQPSHRGVLIVKRTA